MSYIKKHYENLYKSIEKNFRSRNINTSLFSKKEEAKDYVLSLIKDGDSIGYGGSLTVEETGILGELRNKNVLLYDRGKDGISKEEKDAFQKKALAADVFISGVNAVTYAGCMYFVDGVGNRVAPIVYGPSRVILISGVNKLCPDDDYANKRVQNYAAPVNCVRLGRNTPCEKTGLHVDCRSEGRICNIYTKIDFSVDKERIHLVFINEELGY
jgi:L-lactate utilization protein LutB